MIKPIAILYFLLCCMPLLPAAQTVISMRVDGSINPATAAFIHRGIVKAGNDKAACLLIHLNTPGGLLQSTRSIVSDILESPVPVVIYVSPAGSRAASAGVFITMAANIAAMAPGTNIGAAHPVNMQGAMDTVMGEKVTNDAAAFIRSIAEKRKRNLAWAEAAVRKSVSITEQEALEKNIIDLIADNTQDLLRQIDGKTVTLSTGTFTLHTAAAQVQSLDMKNAEKILVLLSDPNIAYVLLLLGIFGILFEFYNPGAIFPGIIGVLCLVLSFYSMSVLPVNYAGIVLIIFAVVLFLLEIKITSHGILAVGGIISLLLGAMMLIRTDSSWDVVKISWSVILSSVVITALFFLFVIGLGLKAQRAIAVTGMEGLIDALGESLETLDPSGTVSVQGEIWNARSIAGTINKGEKVRIIKVENLTLYVERTNT